MPPAAFDLTFADTTAEDQLVAGLGVASAQRKVSARRDEELGRTIAEEFGISQTGGELRREAAAGRSERFGRGELATSERAERRRGVTREISLENAVVDKQRIEQQRKLESDRIESFRQEVMKAREAQNLSDIVSVAVSIIAGGLGASMGNAIKIGSFFGTQASGQPPSPSVRGILQIAADSSSVETARAQAAKVGQEQADRDFIVRRDLFRAQNPNAKFVPPEVFEGLPTGEQTADFNLFESIF